MTSLLFNISKLDDFFFSDGRVEIEEILMETNFFEHDFLLLFVFFVIDLNKAGMFLELELVVAVVEEKWLLGEGVGKVDSIFVLFGFDGDEAAVRLGARCI